MKYKIPLTSWYFYKPETVQEWRERNRKNKNVCNSCGRIKDKTTTTKTCKRCKQYNRAYTFNKKIQKLNETEYEKFKKEEEVFGQE